MAAKKRRSGFRTFAGAVVFIVFAVGFLFACVQKTRSLKAEAAQLDQQISVLEEQLEDEKMRAVESQVQQRYYASDAYKELLARNRLNLIQAGDRLYILE